MECLKAISTFNYTAENGNGKIILNDNSGYSSKKYGLGIGKYTIKNVPRSFAMAIVCNPNNQDKIDLSNNITYTGKNIYKITKNMTYWAPSGSIKWGVVDFYWGDVTIFVTGDFIETSFIRAGDDPVKEGAASLTGYAGGENIFIYNETCKNFHKIDNSIAAVTNAITDIDSENGTINVLKNCINSLQLMKRKIKVQKLNLEVSLDNALTYDAGLNVDVAENELLSVGLISNVNTTINGDGARRKYEGKGGVAIINNKNQYDGSGNEIIGGARFSKNMIDDFLDSLIDNLEQFNGEKKYDVKRPNSVF